MPCQLPAGLAEELSKQYPSSRLVAQDDLTQEHRRLFRKDHGARCPGMVEVDFYGDRKPTWALVIFQDSSLGTKVLLVVARRTASVWKLTSLDSTDAGVAPVVWTEGPGEYRDVLEERKIQAKHPVIVFAGYESWAIVYAWMGAEVAKIWITD